MLGAVSKPSSRRRYGVATAGVGGRRSRPTSAHPLVVRRKYTSIGTDHAAMAGRIPRTWILTNEPAADGKPSGTETLPADPVVGLPTAVVSPVALSNRAQVASYPAHSSATCAATAALVNVSAVSVRLKSTSGFTAGRYARRILSRRFMSTVAR